MIDAHSIYKYVAACTDKYGVAVKWVPKGVPSTNGKEMILPALPITMSQVDVENYKGWVRHETNHIGHSDFEKFLKDKELDPLLMMVMNIIEDERIDYLNDREYDGDRLIHEQMEWNELNKHEGTPPNPMAADMAYPLISWVKSHDKLHTTAAPWSIFAKGRSSKPDVIDKLAEFDKRFLAIKELPREKSYEPLKQLAKDILEKHWPKEAKESREKQQAMVDAMSKALIHSSHSTEKDGAEAEELIAGKGKGSDSPGSHRAIAPSEVMYVKGKSLPHTPADVTDNNRGFVNAVRQALQVMTRKRTEYGVKRGKLHSSLYHRLLDDNPKIQQKVFKRQIPTMATDCAVTLLVDYSGSMSGTPVDMAQRAAASLSYITEQMIGIPTEILTFTDDTIDGHAPRLKIGIAKEFGEKVAAEMVLGRLHAIEEKTGLVQNMDGESLLVAYSRIKNRKEKRKLIIILSDGSPATYAFNGEQYNHTKEVAKQIQQSGVELYGVGIMDSTVKDFYNEFTVIKSLPELIPSLLTIVKRKIMM